MKSGRIGRFGWKAQTTNLREFVLTACAQRAGPGGPPDTSAGDLSAGPGSPGEGRGPDAGGDCDALIAYVRALPALGVRLDSSRREAIEAGRASFVSLGCARCHRPNLGNIEGIYSDLLLHDMGPDLISVTMNVYYGGTQVVDVQTASSLADGSEWRTPPLWGYRDSGPYLHDGRAEDLAEAVKFHKGQASESAARFAGLSRARQSQIEQFLSSLAAPPSAEPIAEAEPAEYPGNRNSMLGPPSDFQPTRRPSQPVRTYARSRADQERLTASRLKMAQNLEKMDKPLGALVYYREIVGDEPDTTAGRTAAARIEALGGSDADQQDFVLPGAGTAPGYGPRSLRDKIRARPLINSGIDFRPVPERKPGRLTDFAALSYDKNRLSGLFLAQADERR